MRDQPNEFEDGLYFLWSSKVLHYRADTKF